MRQVIADDIDVLIQILPPRIQQKLAEQGDITSLLEVVLDLGRPPEARYPQREVILDAADVDSQEIDYVISRIGSFGDDNRAGMERTLHRISAIRNRKGRIVGLTCRVGRAVFGTIKIIEDLVQSGRSILLLGRPGVGKTTMLREIARVLSDDIRKRVIIVDTSNEIAGDGDIPHPAIGRCRRMQVAHPNEQHAVMIEAVENHMPQCIVIDEIGTELEALAARTIAERGVQLVGTAHGNTLENLMMNPTLADLIGGIQSVTLGDEEARRRGTQKSILERKSPPTFEIVVEIQDWYKVAIHADVGEAVDAALRGQPTPTELRWRDETTGEIKVEKIEPEAMPGAVPSRQGVTHMGVNIHPTRQVAPPKAPGKTSPRVFLFGVNKGRLEQVAEETGHTLNIVDNLESAELFVTSKNYYRRKPPMVQDAEFMKKPIYVLKASTPHQMKQFIRTLFPVDGQAQVELIDESEYVPDRPERPAKGVRRALPQDEGFANAMEEAQEAVTQVKSGGRESVELSPQGAYVRRLQHIMAEKNHLGSQSRGHDPERRVRIYRG